MWIACLLRLSGSAGSLRGVCGRVSEAMPAVLVVRGREGVHRRAQSLNPRDLTLGGVMGRGLGAWATRGRCAWRRSESYIILLILLAYSALAKTGPLLHVISTK